MLVSCTVVGSAVLLIILVNRNIPCVKINEPALLLFFALSRTLSIVSISCINHALHIKVAYSKRDLGPCSRSYLSLIFDINHILSYQSNQIADSDLSIFEMSSPDQSFIKSKKYILPAGMAPRDKCLNVAFDQKLLILSDRESNQFAVGCRSRLYAPGISI